MQSRSSSLQVTRRRLLQSAASASLAVSVAGPAILGRAQAQQKTVSFAGWAFEPQVVEANVKRFMEQNKDLAVKYMPLDLQLYNEKMVALINANNDPDCFYVRDTNLGAWVEAGWVQPIDGMPNLDELNKDIFAFNLDAMSYKGKQYGTPYYGDIYVYMYDQKALQKANVAKAPVTLDELKAAALEVKKAGIAKYPILKGFKTNVDGLSEFWSMVLASGGKMFNEALDPVYPQRGQDGARGARVDGRGHARLGDTGSHRPRLDETQARDVFLSGQGVFTSNVGNVMPRANNPQHSKRAGDIKMTKFPGLADVGKGPMGWSRLYCISSKTKMKNEAWRVIYYMGGKDAEGKYYTAKDWYLKYGVGYAFKSMDTDPDIIAAQKAAGYDPDIRGHQYATAKARDNIKAPWYNEWDRFTQQQIQNTLLRKVKPLEALQASAKKAQEGLKKAG